MHQEDSVREPQSSVEPDGAASRPTRAESSNPSGPRAVLAIALPLIASTASMTVMNFVDRMFLLWHSPLEMAAAMPAGLLYFTLLCFPLGLASYVNTFVAQYHGAGRPDRIGAAVWQGVRLGLYCTPLFLLAIPLAPAAFDFAGHDEAVRPLETLYLQILCISSGAVIMGAALSAFYTGRGQTGVVMIVDIVANGVNIVLDYAWIFGLWGFPEWGIAGAAWATTFSQWLKVGIFLALMSSSSHRREYHFERGRQIDWTVIRRLFRYGGPNGLQMLVEMGAITLFIFLVGRLGRDELTATNLAFNVNSVAFLPMLGMGLAVSTIVGQQLGRNRDDLAARATYTALWLTAIYASPLVIAYVATPDLFLFPHAVGTSEVDFEPLRETTIVLLRFVAVFCLFDMLAIIFSSAIKGAGDTFFVLVVNLILPPLWLALGFVGVRYFGGGLIWCWIVITIWVVVGGLVFMLRFWQGGWRSMRVIEPDLLTTDDKLPGGADIDVDRDRSGPRAIEGTGELGDEPAAPRPVGDPAVA
ncbi:MAG: MATE family efflux transporter [Planctomycetota bacterium]|nr:MAG: MATE family efflux transporter [Planctomycetota bacterium]REJ97579.1 MAG: MATE family efflux transporter [Planctomycetota bacterium]